MSLAGATGNAVRSGKSQVNNFIENSLRESRNSDVVRTVKSSVDNVKNTTKNFVEDKIKKPKVDSIYAEYYKRNSVQINKFVESLNSNSPNETLARNIKNSIKGLKYNAMSVKFKFGDIIYSCLTKVVKFRAIKFENVSFEDFLKGILDGYVFDKNADMLSECMKILGKNKIPCGMLESFTTFIITPSKDSYMIYDFKLGKLVLRESNIRDINVLDNIRVLTKGKIPVYKTRETYASNQANNYVPRQYDDRVSSPNRNDYDSHYGNNHYGNSHYGNNQYGHSYNRQYPSGYDNNNPMGNDNHMNSIMSNKFIEGFKCKDGEYLRFGNLIFDCQRDELVLGSKRIISSREGFVCMCNNYAHPKVLSDFINAFKKIKLEINSKDYDNPQQKPIVKLDVVRALITVNRRTVLRVVDGRFTREVEQTRAGNVPSGIRVNKSKSMGNLVDNTKNVVNNNLDTVKDSAKVVAEKTKIVAGSVFSKFQKPSNGLN